MLSDRDFGFFSKLQTSVLLHPVASELLAQGVAEGVVRANIAESPVRSAWTSFCRQDVRTATKQPLIEIAYQLREYSLKCYVAPRTLSLPVRTDPPQATATTGSPS